MTALFLFLVGCGKLAEDDKINFSFDENGNYTGFSDLPSNYTVEDAKSDGYFTSMGVEIVANKGLWDRFAEKSHNNNDASIRMVKFYEESDGSPYFKDLFYRDEYYYLFDSSAESHEKQPYRYLLTLEGQFGSPLKDSGVIVLTNDNTLTFDMVMQSALSSDINYI